MGATLAFGVSVLVEPTVRRVNARHSRGGSPKLMRPHLRRLPAYPWRRLSHPPPSSTTLRGRQVRPRGPLSFQTCRHRLRRREFTSRSPTTPLRHPRTWIRGSRGGAATPKLWRIRREFTRPYRAATVEALPAI